MRTHAERLAQHTETHTCKETRREAERQAHVHTDLVVWKSGSREDGDLLASGNAVHAVDGGDAGLDHLLRVNTALRVDGLAW